MKGKSPISVITDGDTSMKNAIRRVFPNAYHRLCAWHLIRNATTRVGIPAFTAKFKDCMMGDYEIGEFRQKWSEMVDKFGLHEHPRVPDMYEKRQMWCTTYIRGRFFAGFRMTSRCKGLHLELKKYVHSRYNLTEFLQHFHRCVSFMRYREVESDFASIHGDPVLTTNFRSLERSAANVFTRGVFNLFRPVLDRSSLMRVTGCKETLTHVIYTVSKYELGKRVWHVSYESSIGDIKCSCQRMESFGLPCDHILAVLVSLKKFVLPKCLLLKRWTKSAKDDVRGSCTDASNSWDAHRQARHLSLMEYFKDVSMIASESFDEYNDKREKALYELEVMKVRKGLQPDDSSPTISQVGGLRDPANVRSRGCHARTHSTTGGRKRRKTIKCGLCKQEGHNRRSCPTLNQFGEMAESATGVSFPIEDQDMSFDSEEMNGEMEEEEYYEDGSASYGGDPSVGDSSMSAYM